MFMISLGDERFWRSTTPAKPRNQSVMSDQEFEPIAPRTGRRSVLMNPQGFDTALLGRVTSARDSNH
jgi:hypothetical protein